MTRHIPEKLRVTNAGWSENDGAWKVQLGDDAATIAYVWVPGNVGLRGDYDHALKIAERICTGWNA